MRKCAAQVLESTEQERKAIRPSVHFHTQSALGSIHCIHTPKYFIIYLLHVCELLSHKDLRACPSLMIIDVNLNYLCLHSTLNILINIVLLVTIDLSF